MNLFLFPHQDDEYFISHLIFQNPENSICVYLTKGDFFGSNPNTRNKESFKVLQILGVNEENIIFLSDKFPISDNSLSSHLIELYGYLTELLKGISINKIYTTAYEGGHPDHDAAALLAFALGKANQSKVFQYYLYNSFGKKKPFFNVMYPLIDKDLIIERFEFKTAIKLCTLFLHYRSQLKTWIGLSPFAIYNFLILRKISYLEIRASLFESPPHLGELYYEARGWTTYSKFILSTNEFKTKYIG